jgi:potassium-transporting ATPase KdpC subunit
MFGEALKQIKSAVILLILFALLTGIFYPLLILLLAQWLVPWQANGSLIVKDNKMIASKLIGQSFITPEYFWGRPSMTLPFPYNPQSSTGSNFGPTHPHFLELVKMRIARLKQADAKNQALIPIDLVTASASGLDPDISVAAAFYQVKRIAAKRHMAAEEINALITRFINPVFLGMIGEPRVNVLQLNLALDQLAYKAYGKTSQPH